MALGGNSLGSVALAGGKRRKSVGDLRAQDSAVAGSGSVVSTITGDGALQAGASVVSGSGTANTTVYADGALSAGSATASGSGSRAVAGAGSLAADPATAFGYSKLAASGTLAADAGSISASGTVYTQVGTGQASVALDTSEYSTGQSTASLSTSLVARTGQSSTFISTRLYQRGQTTVGFSVSAGAIIATGRVEAGIDARTYATGQSVADTLTRVIGEIDWSDVAASQSWRTVTRLDGVEVLTTGAIEVEAEESSARIATVSVVGPPSAEAGATLDVDLVVGSHIEPVFRGRVTEPSFDPARRVTSYEATDQLQSRIDALTREQIEALTPEATTENGNEDQGWSYLQHRLASWPGSFDTTRDGFFRATRWDGASWMPNAISAALDGSERLSLIRADQVRNRVKLAAKLSWIRLAIREHSASWRAPYTICDFLKGVDGYQVTLPTAETIAEAVAGAGWDVESFTSTSLGGEVPRVICNGSPTAIVGDALTVPQKSAAWTLSKRYSRSMRAGLSYVLEAASSVSRFGLRESTRTVSYRDPSDEGEFLDGIGSLQSPATDPKGDQFTDQLDGGSAEEIVADAINRAMTRIASAHRETTLSVETLVRPDLERHHRVEMQLPFVTAQGKVSRIRHRLDTGSGSATSEIEIRLFQGGDGQPVSADWSGFGDLGLDRLATRADDSVSLPDPGTYVGGIEGAPAESDDWQGWIFNATPPQVAGDLYSQGFAVRTPPIDMPSQDADDLESESTIAVHLPEDPLVYA